MKGFYERPSEYSDKSTNRTAFDLNRVILLEIFVFVNKETQKKGKALKVHFDTEMDKDKNKELVIFANNKQESDQLEEIFKTWCGMIDKK